MVATDLYILAVGSLSTFSDCIVMLFGEYFSRSEYIPHSVASWKLDRWLFGDFFSVLFDEFIFDLLSPMDTAICGVGCISIALDVQIHVIKLAKL